MKVYTMTWYYGNNYGSILQAYALPRAISQLGYPCEILAYTPTIFQKIKNMLVNRSLVTHLKYKINAWKLKSKKGADKGADLDYACFDAFRAAYMPLTAPAHTTKAIRHITGEDSVFVCGSDQIWNPQYYNPYYFLHFVKDSTRKIPYAPSFGVKEIPAYQKKRIKKSLSAFHACSVREQRGAEMIQELTGREAFVACDPTVLLNKEEWLEIATPIQKPEKPYIFCYFLSYNEQYMATARRAAEVLGMELKMLPMMAKDYDREETIKDPVGPTEWISWLNGASYVLTDSFHCSLFSIAFGKDFYIFQRFASGNKRGENTRIENLLANTDLTDRMIAWEEARTTFPTIPQERREKAEGALRAHAQTSRAWLKDALALAKTRVED